MTEPVPQTSAGQASTGQPPAAQHQGAQRFSHEDRMAMTRATTLYKPIARARKMAAFNGWVTGFFAVCCYLTACFGVVSLILAIALSVVAYNEFRGRKLLGQMKPNATTLLGYNQVGFVVVIMSYAGWMIVNAVTAPAASEQYAQYGQQISDMMSPHDSFITNITILVYVLVGSLGLIFQGANAMYYFTRKKSLQKYLAETPDWIVELQIASFE